MSKFETICTPEKTFKLFFDYRYVNVPKKTIDSWDPKDYDSYLIDYKLNVDNSVIDNASTEIREALLELISEDTFVKMTKPDHPNQVWFRALFPMNVISAFKRIFISTLVYHYKGMRSPKTESVSFIFDTTEQTVTIKSLDTYIPENDPYYEYAQNAAVLLSSEAIGLSEKKNENDKIRDFYDSARITKWKPREKLEKEPDASDCPGVYMLYDQNTNQIYVGKAKRIVDRINQHIRTVGDPMANFTHYRFSGISEEYFELLYLIENSAIHDLAWIIDMPSAKRYKPSLANVIFSSGNALQTCSLANTVEHQTRKQ